MGNMNKKTMHKYAKQVHGDMIQLLKTKYRSLKRNTDAQNTIHPGWSNAKQFGLLDECVKGDPHSPIYIKEAELRKQGRFVFPPKIY